MKFIYFLLLLALICFDLTVSASDSDTLKSKNPDFLSSLFNDISINPAYTGISGGHHIMLNASIEKPFMVPRFLYRPQQYGIGYDVAFGKKELFSLGASFTDSKGGALRNNSLKISAALNFNLSRSAFYHRLRLGASAELCSAKADLSRLVWGDQIDPRYGFIYSTQEGLPSKLKKSCANFNLGLWYNNPVFFLGMSLLNMTKPNIGLYSATLLPYEFNISSGGNIPISNSVSLHPSVNINIIEGYKGKFNSYSPAIICSYQQKYIAGISYPGLNKIGIHAGYVLAEHFTFFASCEFSANNDLNQPDGPLSYMGGKIMYNFKTGKK